MINLVLDERFKSLEPFSKELPDFVVLTGLNGAGKTQLLEGISKNIIHANSANNISINSIKYVTGQDLIPNEGTTITRDSINVEITNLWSNFNSSRHLFQNNEYTPSMRASVGYMSPENIKIIKEISKNAEKNIEDLSNNDLYFYYPLKSTADNIDIFKHNFSMLFKRYQVKFEQNAYKRYRNTVDNNKEYNYLEDCDFVKIFGEAPWTFVNKIITEAKLDYQVNSPLADEQDSPFELKLINNITGIEIYFSQLSSGEKTLMSLALALYNSEFEIELPQLILMDEPDASLHPSMCKQLIDIIQNVFVAQKGIKVVITTHSPSTIAFAPEESIFSVKKIGERINKITKDGALKLLTSGVPSFSINYENRRQIFVESPNDVVYYERLYQKLSDYLIPDISLSFISSGDSRIDKNGTKVANCDQVVNITKIMRDTGNRFVWGIIDWDLKNTSSDFVKVLGNGNRYNIENYLFDPLILAALLLRVKAISRENLNLNKQVNYTDFKSLEIPQLQYIVDLILEKLSKTLKVDNEVISTIELINGVKINIPTWYLHHQGHDLEELIITTFPKLNEIKKGREEVLKIYILDQVIDDIPELISVDILELFKELQSVN